MKKLLLIFALTLPIAASAQQASVKVAYEETRHVYSQDDKLGTRNMTLLTGKEGSKYFNEQSQYCDSMTSTPEGKKKLREIQMAAWVSYGADGSMSIDMTKGNAPNKKIYTYIVKDFSKNEMKVYDNWGDEHGYYTEPFSEMEWEIESDSTRTILNYECVMARTSYHGRNWRAWFTPEIPVQDGPWKFQGLPGLILAAESDNDIALTATGIEAVTTAIQPVYSPGSYSKTDRKKALKNEEYFSNNREAIISARFGSSVKFENKDQEKKPWVRTRYVLETDY